MNQSNLIPLPTPEPVIPTIEMCVTTAVSLGMPAEEGERFFHHHEQKDWMIGKNKIKRWRNAMAIWRLNWVKWNKPGLNLKNPDKPLPMELFVWSKELEEVERQQQAIRSSYSENLSWSIEDRARFKQLRERKQELLNKLGRVV